MWEHRRFFSRAGWLVVFALGAAGARAETRWMETGATIDTVVADTQTVPPVNPLQPLRAQVPFKGFRYPLVDEAENVTFITDDATVGQQGLHHGIYRSEAASNALKAVVLPTDTIPGTAYPFECLRGIQPAERGSDFVFNATSRQGGRGLFVWSAGKVTQVARTGDTVLPGEKTPLSKRALGGAPRGARALRGRDGRTGPAGARAARPEERDGPDPAARRGRGPRPSGRDVPVRGAPELAG